MRSARQVFPAARFDARSSVKGHVHSTPWWLIVTCLVSVSGAACGGDEQAASPVKMELTACTVQGRSAECGRLNVPENRITGEGRRLDLNVVVLPATNPAPLPDPIVYFAGGPGGAATDEVGNMAVVFSSLNHDRDIIFVDQRGVGGSNELICQGPMPDDAKSKAITDHVTSCLAGLDADPRFYTTSMAADDVADVVHALGYSRANIYGGSYGATIAQVFLRRHEDMVRTATLGGATLLDVPIFNLVAANTQTALEQVFARCDADHQCSAAFPNLRGEWNTLLEQLASAPVTLPADRAPNGIAIVLDDSLLAAAVHQMLMSADTAAQLPLVIHGLAISPDRVAVLDQYADTLSGMLDSTTPAPLMNYIIRCNEDWAKFDPAAVERTGAGSYYLPVAVENARWWTAACPLFPTAGKAADDGVAKVSDVPVLVMNGSADPQDPPANMADAMRLWPNGVHLTEPGQSHGISAWQCRESITAAFITNGTVRDLDSSCLAEVALPTFVTS